MKFENALVAMRKGLKVQRASTKGRLNSVCLFMRKGKIYTKQTSPLSEHKISELVSLSANQIAAEDWTTQGVN